MTEFKTIGVINTPFDRDGEIPYQAFQSSEIGNIEIFEEYEEALQDIEGFSHLIAIYEFHNQITESNKKKYSLRTNGLLVKPFLDDRLHGIFSTRSPVRPNPIGISVIELIGRDGRELLVRGVDMLNGTPLLDLKPYVPSFDHRENARIGWMEGRI
jgi:tRNA-Thr(GGU) m(6)t(6)A37 methyltransferase TsaA